MENYDSLKNKLDNDFTTIINKYIDNEKLREMFYYILDGGKRLRPILFYCILNSANSNNIYKPFSSEFALCLELLHSMSLILDDLPCMDNDSTRRGKDAFHIKYGEKQAYIFSSYIFYLCIRIIKDNILETQKDNSMDFNLLRKILNIIYTNLGMLGACGGQFLDLCPIIPNINKKEFIDTYSNEKGMQELLNLKTTTIFKLGFLLGYNLGNFDIDIKIIDDLANNFGLAFQIYDDFDDLLQDTNRKSEGYFTPNYVLTLGKEESLNVFNKCVDNFLLDYNNNFGENIILIEIINKLRKSVLINYNSEF